MYRYNAGPFTFVRMVMNVKMLLIASLISGSCFAQFNRSVTLRAMANINLAKSGLGNNDAGAGLGLDASFFSRKRLQVLVEAAGDRFIGDKMLEVDPLTGEEAGNAAVYSFRAGPQYFITREIALALTYGPTWHSVRSFNATLSGGFKGSFTGFTGAQKRFVAKLYFVSVPDPVQSLQYFGVGLGYRF
ncbi:MAG TPA: hypothetical protein VHK69_13990 [Chitinophagaceae bacterium]|jgi:hypothetical protein|nr:hypothetical protein [Chitinophagaceae bacterium]